MNKSDDHKADNASEMFSYLSQIGSDLLNIMQERLGQSVEATGTSVFFEMMENYRRFCSSQVEHPGNLVDRQIKIWQQQMGLWNTAILRMSGQDVPLSIQTPKGDKRFSDPDWEQNPVFNFFRESYLLQSEAIMATIDEASGIDDSTRSRLRFFTRQMINAAAPSNYAGTNPEVLKLTMETAGKNLVDGLKNLAADLHRSTDVLNIRMTDSDAFELGVDVASTPGKVIFRNRLIELIQYAPSTESVHRIPLLMVPPWVNKFYIMDLRESNSFVRWAVAQGHTVFMVSWVNPDASYRNVGIDQYLGEGLLAALDVISEVTGEESANVVGYCAGGILLAIAMAWLAVQGREDRIRSATHFATLFDFSEPGDIGVFIDDPVVTALEQQLDHQGYMDGRMMAVSFALLRENDLYWNYYVQNYLKGQDPAAFDLLYWNSDCTNLPAPVHKFFLRQLYMGNLLKEADALTVLEEKIDLRRVKTPAFILATVQDHIARWPSCYAGTQLYAGPVQFVLGESGHIAGVMNPPGSKYGYFTGNANEAYPRDSQEWFRHATRHDDSWWPLWSDWIAPFTGGQLTARQPGSAAHQPICEAPGEYVRKRIA